MSVTCVIVRLKDETIDELLVTPRKVRHFYLPDRDAWSLPIGTVAESYPECSAPSKPEDSIYLDKSWDGLDYLLSSGKRDNGICRLLTIIDSERIDGDIGCRPPAAFRSMRVREFHEFLATTSAETL